MNNKLRSNRGSLAGFFIHTLGFVIFVELATRGKWFELSKPDDGRAHFFTAQAFSLINGRFNVEPFFLAGWNGECFNYYGNCLGYFGITPSLLRIPLIPFLNGNQMGINPFWYFLFAWLIYVFASNGVINETTILLGEKITNYKVVFLRITVHAGPILFLLVNPYVYYEAILWGVSLGLTTIYFLLKFSSTLQNKYIYIAVFCSLLTLHARIVEGIGVFAATIALVAHNFIAKKISKSLFFRLALLTSLALSSLPALNLIRFGEIQPTIGAHHGGVLADPYRLTFYNSVGVFRITRIPKSLSAYFFPNFENWNEGFAFEPNRYNLKILFLETPLYSVEQTEYFSPFSSSFPFTFVLGVFGIIYLFQAFRFGNIFWIFLPTSISILLLSANIGATQRYLADLWIPLFLFSIVGISKLNPPKLPKLVAFLLLVLLSIQFYQSINLTFNFWKFWGDIPGDFYQQPWHLFEYFRIDRN